MTTAQITVNDRVILNGLHEVGFAKSLRQNGQECSAATGKNNKAVYYTTLDPAFPNRRHVFDGPVYVSTSPSDHTVNPDFVAFIDAVIDA